MTALALGAFALLGAAGLAIIARHTMLGAVILTIFAAVRPARWRLLESDHPGAGAGRFAGVVALMFAPAPDQWNLDSTVHEDLSDQGEDRA